MLLLANSLLTLELGADHALVTDTHSYAAEHRDAIDPHAGARGDPESLHHVAAIDGGTDEHGHHFHVHLPAHALVASTTTFEYAAAPAAEPKPAPLLPASLSYAPPVPPPNA